MHSDWCSNMSTCRLIFNVPPAWRVCVLCCYLQDDIQPDFSWSALSSSFRHFLCVIKTWIGTVFIDWKVKGSVFCRFVKKERAYKRQCRYNMLLRHLRVSKMCRAWRIGWALSDIPLKPQGEDSSVDLWNTDESPAVWVHCDTRILARTYRL